ncbi:MAG TPA: hypothetical protein VIM52_09285 [Stellaceae bacterium]
MSSFAKTTVLSLTLLAGAAFAAHAQSGSVAALPPGNAVAPPAAASGAYPGPNPGVGYYPAEKQSQPVTPSPQYVGPSPGAGYYPAEKQTQGVQPSPDYVGPRPN